MNYKNIYERLINKAQLEMTIKNYSDGLKKHHIIPKSLGGPTLPENLVLLTYLILLTDLTFGYGQDNGPNRSSSMSPSSKIRQFQL